MTAFTRGSITEIARGGRFGARPDRTAELNLALFDVDTLVQW